MHLLVGWSGDIDAPPPQEESSVHLSPSNGSSTEPEELTLLQLSQNADPTAGKGKREAPLKRTVGETTSSSTTQTSSASIPNSRMLKVVKQEK
ncbi:hypothetical protein K1719_019296 [Acacia pycnantha]|nr:hypothetical protein K1719_019296 [Acacia pycnantha]